MKEEEEGCRACPAGTKVRRRCNGTIEQTCDTCPYGTFADIPNNKPYCQRCRRCRRKEIELKSCSPTINTVCGCREGYIYHPAKPCYKCPKGQIATMNKCANATSPHHDGKHNIIKSTGPDVFLIAAVGGGVLFLFLIVFVAWLLWNRRRERARRNEAQHGYNNAPDVLNGVLKHNKTPPPLPPKMSRRRNENVYGPDPQQQAARPLVEKKIISRQLPFSLVHDMNLMLSTSHQKNYKHLAGELGYSYAFVKSLESQTQPLETLIDDYMSGPNPTKEKLLNALVNIGRNDVAQMVSDDL